MSAEQLRLVDAVSTLPGKSLEQEVQRRIAAINAITVYCGVEEGAPYRHVQRVRLIKSESPPIHVAESDVALREAISSIKTDRRPLVCFCCIGNPGLAMRQRVAKYATPGSLSRHFLRKHVKKLHAGQSVDCMDCGVQLRSQKELLVHVERFHSTVSRGPAERLIA
jgi:hypothetical protein